MSISYTLETTRAFKSMAHRFLHAAAGKVSKDPVEEDLRVSLSVAGDVVASPTYELGKLLFPRHGSLLLEDRRDVNAKEEPYVRR